MRKLIYTLLFLTLAGVALAVLLLFFWREATRDPLEGMVIPLYGGRVGPPQSWDDAHDLRGGRDPLDARYQNIPGQMRVEKLGTGPNSDGQTVDQLKVIIPWKQHAQDEFQFQFERVTLTAPDYSWQDGSLKISVQNFWFEGYQVENDSGREEQVRQAQIYLLEPESGESPGWQNPSKGNKEWRGRYIPSRPEQALEIDLRVEGAGSDPVRATQQPLFDRHTRAQVSNAWGVSYRENGVFCDYDIPAFYDIPPLAVVDVFAGPVEVHEWKPRENAILKTPEFRIHYLGAIPGEGENLKRNHGYTRNGTFQVEMDRFESPGKSIHVFSVSPQEVQLRLEFDFGEVESKEQNSGWLPEARFFNLEVAEDQLQSVRVKYYPHAKRVFTEAPVLPVAPANRRLNNGLDIQLPLVEISGQEDFPRIAAEALGTGFIPGMPGSATHPAYPLWYENITIRELLREFLIFYPELTIEYDPISNILSVRPRKDAAKPWDPAIQWVQDKISKP